MDELLTAVSTTKPKLTDALDESSSPSQPARNSGLTGVSSPEQALAVLREQPDAETLHHVLNYLSRASVDSDGFNIRSPGSLSAQIINTLLDDTVPNYWDAWQTTSASENDKLLLLECLGSVSGLGAIVARLKSLTQDLEKQQQQQQVTKSNSAEQQVRILLDTLTYLLQESAVKYIWRDINTIAGTPTQKQLLWREFVSLTATGRIISIAAHSKDLLKSTSSYRQDHWYASGSEFAEWLGRAIALFACDGDPTGAEGLDRPQSAAIILGRSFSLGYTGEYPLLSSDSAVANHPDHVIWGLLARTPIKDTDKFAAFLRALHKLRAHEQRQFLFSFLNILSRKILIGTATQDRDLKSTSKAISGAVALLQAILNASDSLKENLVFWLTNATIGSASASFATRRVAVAALQLDEGNSSQRARLLGMFAATSISELIDKPENRLKFGIPETESEEANWYRQLTQARDLAGSIEDFQQPTMDHTAPRSPVSQTKGKLTPTNQRREKSKFETKSGSAPRIVEIVEDSDEDDDLVPYSKPDSDPEDDSEDPTQVTRNQPTAPVYIRDLLAGLRESKNYDRHQLALSTAASLIRRKTDFGKEVKDNLEELASVLIGLNDQFDIENFQEVRQQALISVVLADPAQTGPYLVRCFYAGDYSFSQRVAILTAIGLSARELAGFKDDALVSDASTSSGPGFPSEMLPEKLHRLYSTESNPVDTITNKLKHTMITPLALDAADKVTGPSTLKVRTFSSRMQVEKNRKIITNELAKIVAQSLFFPLTGGWWSHAKAL
ncbi:telomere binding protein [Botryosphaeria dothidea]